MARTYGFDHFKSHPKVVDVAATRPQDKPSPKSVSKIRTGPRPGMPSTQRAPEQAMAKQMSVFETAQEKAERAFEKLLELARKAVQWPRKIGKNAPLRRSKG